MAAAAATTPVTSPDLSALLTPILPALAPAAASSSPALAVLPFLAPILRQRVQILSSTSSCSPEPWLRLLCYDQAKAARLAEISASGALEPHPVSGEVEVDWSYDAATRFRRLDRETLQCLVVLGADHGGLAFLLVWCVKDPEGAPDGWRIGEVTVSDAPSAPFAAFGGAESIDEAERLFGQENTTGGAVKPSLAPVATQTNGHDDDDDDDDDDDGYWDRYDATPARTPANNRSPAPPPAATNGGTGLHHGHPAKAAAAADEEEDDYYALYDDIQPAMDAHDPDEEAHAAQLDPPVAAGFSPLAEQLRRESWEAVSAQQPPDRNGTDSEERFPLQHPRPESSASSHGSDTVAKLEAAAAAGGGMQEQAEFGVRQHVSRSIRSLFQLSRSMGIGRYEFEQMVKAELDVLGMMEE